MDRHAPFFSRRWLDLPREGYQEQLTRLHRYLDSFSDQTEFELIQVCGLSLILQPCDFPNWD